MRFFSAVLVASLIGCGGIDSSPTPGPDAAPPISEGTSTGSGTFGGQPFNPAGAVFLSPLATADARTPFSTFFPTAAPPVSGQMTALVFGNDPKTCGSFSSKTTGALQVFAVLFDADASGKATVASKGDYKITNQANVPWTGKSALVLAGPCGVNGNRFANAGTITITNVSDTQLTGTFDITINLGDTYGSAKGNFTAAPCSAIASTHNSTC